MFEKEVENYIAGLNKSKNTCDSYRRALMQMCEFMYVKSKSNSKTEIVFAEEIRMESSENKHADIVLNREAKLADLISAFINELRITKSPATVVQVISILKGFFDYEISLGQMQTNPLCDIEPPKLEKKPKREFTFSQIPQGYAAKAVRDRAMITVLDETGMKVSELLNLKLQNVEFDKAGQTAIVFERSDKETNSSVRYLSKEASDILYDYIYATREEILAGAAVNARSTGATGDTKSGAKTDLLFTNMDGRAMSRQGFWKNMRAYGREEVQPQTATREEVQPQTATREEI